MHQKLLVSSYIAIKHLVSGCLTTSLSVYTGNEKILCMEDMKVPLYRGRYDGKILYISGLALQLSKSHNSPAMEIAHGIATHLSTTCNNIFTVRVVSPGWIHLELTHSTLATWLQGLVVRNEILQQVDGRETTAIQNSSAAFAAQYTYARCNSLLMLAHREGLIQLREVVSDTIPKVHSTIYQQVIPWLSAEQKLRLHHPAEGHLISELLQIVDAGECLTCNDTFNWEKATLSLCQAWEKFWCECRIWGEVKTTFPELAQARLGLLMATQFVLKSLLKNNWKISAPLEL